MKLFILCISLWAIIEVSSSGVTIGLTPYSQPIQTQYQAQDAWGQYVYGYATGTSAKSEAKSANGITQGGYSYIDPNGILQSVQYISDPVNGFRVAATNLPQDVPAVALAKLQHLAQYQSTKLEHELTAQRDAYASAPIVVNPVQDLPEVALARAEHLAAVHTYPASAPIVVNPVQDLPEVARARAEHLAAVHAYPASAPIVVNPVQDLPEVARARVEHLAAVHAYPASAPIVVNPVQDLPEVARARAEHLSAVEATKLRDLQAAQHALISPIPAQLVNTVVPIKTHHLVQVPISAHSYIPAIATSSQYQTQDAYGQYSYGYVSPLSSKSETKTADGITRGGYSYLDANGIVQTVNYISDPVNGFRVAATNLPQDAPAAKIVTAPVAVINPNVVPPQAHAQVLSNVPLGYYRSEIIY